MLWLLLLLGVGGIVAFAIVYAQFRRDEPRVRRVEGKALHAGAEALKALRDAGGQVGQQLKQKREAAAARRAAQRKTSAPRPVWQWLGPGQTLVLHGITIHDPLVYLTQDRARFNDPSAIDPRLPIEAPSRRPSGPELPYWPRYDERRPHERFIYLNWLSSGRSAMPPEIGYAFMFFYGLERRVLIDKEDVGLVVNEVLRLRRLHASAGAAERSGSFESYTGGFLRLLAVAGSQALNLSQVRELLETARYLSDEDVAVALAWFKQCELPLPDWAAFLVAGQLPQAQRSVVTRRVGDEFRALFFKRYSEQYGAGFELQQAKHERTFSYRTASNVLFSAEAKGPNVMGVASQFKPLANLWNQCVDDLRRLSTVVGKTGQDELTADAWEALPTELRSEADHPLTQTLCDLVDKSTDEQGRTLIAVDELAPALLGQEVVRRVSPTNSRKLCQMAEHIGYGLEPDARLTGKSYKAGERLSVFLRVSDRQPDAQRYNAAACMMGLGAVVAAADGHIHPDELAMVTQEIERWFRLNDDEQRRLEALQTLLLVEGVDTQHLSATVKTLRPEQRQAIAKVLLALAAHDGVVTKEEVSAIRRCYRTLGLPADEVERALESLTQGAADEPVTVQVGAPPSGGEAIPAPRQPRAEGLRLNRAAILAIMQESQEVANMLAEAMNVAKDEDTVAPIPPFHTTYVEPAISSTTPPDPAHTVGTPAEIAGQSLEVVSADPSLPQRYAAFYQVLVSRPQWSVEEAQALARQHGLMLSGALDALNDWAFEKYASQLFVEEGSTLIVERGLLS